MDEEDRRELGLGSSVVAKQGFQDGRFLSAKGLEDQTTHQHGNKREWSSMEDHSHGVAGSVVSCVTGSNMAALPSRLLECVLWRVGLVVVVTNCVCCVF